MNKNFLTDTEIIQLVCTESIVSTTTLNKNLWHNCVGNFSNRTVDSLDSKERELGEQINKCRSLTKEFWADTYRWLDRNCDCHEDKLKTWASRHDRFIQQVKPIDTLPDYDPQVEDYVFRPHPKLRKL